MITSTIRSLEGSKRKSGQRSACAEVGSRNFFPEEIEHCLLGRSGNVVLNVTEDFLQGAKPAGDLKHLLPAAIQDKVKVRRQPLNRALQVRERFEQGLLPFLANGNQPCGKAFSMRTIVSA